MKLFWLALISLAHAESTFPTWKMVHSLDTDKNNRISLSEFASSDQLFTMIDADGDGFLTRSEVVAARKQSPILAAGKLAPKLSALDPSTGKKKTILPTGKPLALIFGTHT